MQLEVSAAVRIEDHSDYQACVQNGCTLLSLSYNSLTGTVPTQMGALTQLSYLYLHSNSLTGTVPTQMGALTKLTYL
ncbi:hypothetical protein CYMTET_53444 [Cymbomonas tetramitiformis]|nr:hypothetical protein CYMTET_53444 [Cymbomonas tetramitiformis]